MDLTEISDRLEIEKLVTDYANAVDDRNLEKFNELFTTDAFIDYTAVGGISGNLPEIIAYLHKALEPFPNYQHLISNIAIDLEPNSNEAAGKVMCFNPMVNKQGQTFFLGLWYLDNYQKINGAWKIKSRIEKRSWAHNVPNDIYTGSS